MDGHTLAVVVLVALAGAGSVAAPAAVADDSPPPPPAAFYGDLEIADEPAPAGVEVVAKVDGEERGSIVTDGQGEYGGAGIGDEKLVVNGTDADEGTAITFVVNGHEADETATWQSGTTSRLNLSVPVDDPGRVEVEDVERTENGSVEATIGNPGDFRTVGTVAYRLATASTPLDANATVDDRSVDLGPGENATVTFETGDLPVGAYHHGVVTPDDEWTAPLSVEGDRGGDLDVVLLGDVTDDGAVTLADVIGIHRHVIGLDPSEPFVEDRADVNRDDGIDTDDAIGAYQRSLGLRDGPRVEVVGVERTENGSVEATVENAGDYGAVGAVAYRLATAGTPLDANATVDDRSVDLGSGENATVTFETGDLPVGEYHHGVVTPDDERTEQFGVEPVGSAVEVVERDQRVANATPAIEPLAAN